MTDDILTCRAGKDDLQKLLDLCDYLDTAREVIKRFPRASLVVIAHPSQGTLTYSLDLVDDSLAAEVKRAFPQLGASTTLTFHC